MEEIQCTPRYHQNNWTSSLPNARSSMAGTFWDCEEHEVMVCGKRNRSILRPIVSKIMHQYSLISVDHSLPRRSIRVVRWGYELNVRPIFTKFVCITTPFVESRLQKISHQRIRLQAISNSVFKPPEYKTSNKSYGAVKLNDDNNSISNIMDNTANEFYSWWVTCTESSYTPVFTVFHF